MRRFVTYLSLAIALYSGISASHAQPPANLQAAPQSVHPTAPLNKNSDIVFLPASAAAEKLGANDIFFATLSSIDRQLRLKSKGPVSADEFRNFVQAQAIDFSADDIDRLKRLTGEVQAKAARLKDLWPKQVYLIKTTGNEEGGAAYCRGDAIVLPRKVFNQGDESLRRLLIHELFHILSRQSADRQAQLYALVGFEACAPITLPDDLPSRKLTNPDAPSINSVASVSLADEPIVITPVLFSRKASYETAENTDIFAELEFKLLVVEKQGDAWTAVVPTRLLAPDDVAGFFEKIGRNTSYIIHPEEVLADNFVFLLEADQDKPDPWLIEKLGSFLSKAEDK